MADSKDTNESAHSDAGLGAELERKGNDELATNQHSAARRH